MKVTIDRHSGKAPRPAAEALVGDSTFPFSVWLTHTNLLPLVVPSSGIYTPLQPNQAYQVKVKSFHQAWLLVTDLSEFAARTDDDSAEYAVLTDAEFAVAPAAEVAETPAVIPTTDAANLDATEVADSAPPAGAKANKEKVK
jgi:hypothetical protein